MNLRSQDLCVHMYVHWEEGMKEGGKKYEEEEEEGKEARKLRRESGAIWW